jgi:Na+-translocating ferredoxin:NAD+ oxidoreductase RnfE subunit
VKTPDITPQALGAFAILIVTNVLILAGLDIGAKREAALAALVNGLAVLGFLIHDAIVRHGRATGLKRSAQLPPPPA